MNTFNLNSRKSTEVILENKKIQVITSGLNPTLFSREQIEGITKATYEFNASLNRIPRLDKTNFSVNKSISFDSIAYDDIFIKYVSEKTLNNFILKGFFQFGTIEYYQNTENINIRDRFEGFSNIFLNINGKHLNTSSFCGYNYLIFCGTNTMSESHSEQFGNVKIKIHNLTSFCESVKKAIGAKKYHIGKVIYDNFKIYESELIELENFDESNLMHDNILSLIRKHSIVPSLFVKPESYSKESEIRIVFEMDKDQKRPLRINNKGLLDFITIESA